MKLPKVCFFNSNIPWGGAEKWYLELSESLHKEGYETAVITNVDSGLGDRIEALGNQRVIRFPVGNLSFLNPFKTEKLTKLFLSEGFDALIMNLSADLKFAGRAAFKAGIPIRLFSRQSAIPVKNTAINRYYYKSVITEVLVNSEKTAETILQNNPNLIDKSKIRLIYSGLDLEEIDGQENRSYGTDLDKKFVIGNLGRLSKQKAQHYLLDLAEKLIPSRKPFKILIGGDGELKDDLMKACNERGLNEYVEFVGFVNSTKGFMNSIDLFVLTSIWEGFGYVIAEAMACERPALAFNVSSNPEVLHNSESGYLIEPYNIDEMASRVIEFIDNPDLQESFGKRGREIVEEKFSLKVMVEEVKKALLNPSS